MCIDINQPEKIGVSHPNPSTKCRGWPFVTPCRSGGSSHGTACGHHFSAGPWGSVSGTQQLGFDDAKNQGNWMMLLSYT